jgi:EmrB/QacA subfamily drug resistance transporter
MAEPASHQSQSPKTDTTPAAEIRWVLPVTILGSSMGFIDGSVVNVALPAMQATLHSTLATMQWVINAYMLMLASLILLGGSLGDRFGRKRIFIVGLIVFAAASVGCGAAPSAAWLIAARAVQGAGAALLVPASLAIIGTAYSEEARGRAIGTWSAAAAITTAVGPPLGGWLVDVIGWQSIFFINPPIAAVTLFLATKLAPDHGADKKEKLDLRGSALVIIALGLFSYGLIALGDGMRVAGTVALLGSVPAAALFILVEVKSRTPMLPPKLFRNRNFSGANALTLVLYAALSGSLFMLPFMLIKVHGYTATGAGASFLPFSVIMGAGSRWAGGLSDRVGARLPLIGGPLLTGCGFAWLALTGHDPNYWTSVFPGLVFVGTGMTFAIPPLTSTVFNSVPKAESGMASGINNAAARGGGLIAVAAIGLAFGGADLAAVNADALQAAYRMIMLTAAALAVLSAICAGLTISPKVAEKSKKTA